MDRDKIKIIYDISVLGNCLYLTGIPRVSEEMAIGLCRHPECEIIFGSGKNSYSYVKKYLKRAGYFPGNRLSKPDMLLPFGFFIPCLGYCYKRRRELKAIIKGGSKHNFMLKAGKELLGCVWKAMDSFVINDVSAKDCRAADIYHATRFQVTEAVRKYGNLSVFQTVHDIIPILYPRYCVNDQTQQMKRNIGLIPKTDFLLCVSNSTRDDLLNYNRTLNPDRVFVTHLAASKKFHPCESPGEVERVKRKHKIPEGGRYILSVATFDPRKNLHLLIRSFAELVKSEKINDLFLVLAGCLGWDYGKIFQEVEDNSGIKDRIVITGYVDDADLSPLYTGALAFVYPSLYEGFGLPPLEAMACGAPVITSNTSSLPEVVGDAGIMVEPDDVDGLSAAIHKVYKSEFLRADMSRRSRERAKLFSWEKCADQTVEAYKKAKTMN